MRHLLRCMECNIYTMDESCPGCGKKTVSSRPAKFSPKDPYAEYRRKAKKDLLLAK